MSFKGNFQIRIGTHEGVYIPQLDEAQHPGSIQILHSVKTQEYNRQI